jgi:hypothetical protein
MPNSALYFPYISVPTNAWTTQAILYWDRLTTIVPLELMDSPEQLDIFTRELLSEGLVAPIFPGQYIYQVEKFDECFIRYIEQRHQLRSYQQNAFGRNVTRIHAEKLGRIPDFLVDEGLAKRIDSAWYDVATPIANQFMAYLATVLGAIPDVNATPITDKAFFASFLGAPRTIDRSNSKLHASKAREVILNALLPVPAEPPNVNKLLRFKQRHGALLPSLRTNIEAHCAHIATLPHPEERVASTQAFIADCQLQVEEIEAAMHPAFGKIVFSSLVPLFGSGLALKATDFSNEIAYAGSALSFAATAYQAIWSIRGNRDTLMAKPLAYIANARRSLRQL